MQHLGGGCVRENSVNNGLTLTHLQGYGQGRVADVARTRERRSPTGQGLLRQEGPPTYAILSRNSVLSRFTRFLKGFRRALNESHPAFVEHSKKAILLS